MADDFPAQMLFALAVDPGQDGLVGQAGQVADFLVGAAEEDGPGLVAESGPGRRHGVAEAAAGRPVLDSEPAGDGGHDGPERPGRQV